MEPVIVGVAVVVVLVAVRHLAARRVAAGQGRYAWLMFLPMMLGAVVILWAGIQMFMAEPVAGAALTLAGGLYLGILLGFLVRLSRSVTSAGPNGDVATAVTESAVDYLTTLMGLMLVGGLVAVVILIVWGLGQAGR